MGFTPYSQIVSPPVWQAPVSEDTLIKGALLGEQNIQQSRQATQEGIDRIFNIQAISPQDEEVLAKRQQELQESLSGINMSALSNPQTKSQINAIINRFSTDPDILAVATRSKQYFNELATKKDYESKGKQYVSPLLRQAQKYIDEGVYKTDTRFNKSGFVAPDNKELDESLKAVPEFENWIKNGAYDDHLKGKATGALATKAYQLFTSNPQWQALHNDNFEQQMEGFDVTEVVNQGIEGIQKVFPFLPPEEQERALLHMQEGLELQKNNPYLPSALTSKMREDYYQNQAYMAAEAATYANTVDHRPNEFVKIAQQYENSKKLELYKQQTDLFPYLSKEDQEKMLNNKDLSSINWSTAAKSMQDFKLMQKKKEAELYNPLIKDKAQLQIGNQNVLYEQAKQGIEKEDEAIPVGNIPFTINLILSNKEKAKALLKEANTDLTDEDITKIMTNLEENKISLNEDDISVKDKTLRVDPDGGGDYLIPKSVLKTLLNDEYDKQYSSSTPTTKTETGRFKSPSTGKIKIVYSDGTEEIIDGQ